MFAKMDESGIKTLVVDAQYNNGGSSQLCDELLLHLYPLDKMKHFSTYLRFSDLMAAYNPRIAIAKKSWENDGHKDELYQMPAPRTPADFQQPKLFEGKVVFVMGKRTFSSAGMLFTLARDNHIGTIIGTTSTFSPSHYGEVLPYRLPNTSVLGSISCKFFARPNAAMVDDKCMTPDVKVNLDDKDAAWKYIIDNYGKK
jgi:C-terminal processing protease CtpA/Prc